MEHNMMLEQISDWIIAIAYLSIPIQLVYFLCRNGVHPIMHDLRARIVTGLFAAFILLCGTTHGFNAIRTNLVIAFLDNHGPDAPSNALTSEPSIERWGVALHVAKVLTALVSVATVLVLMVIMPPILEAVGSIPKLEEGLRSKIIELNEARSLAEEANTRKGEFMSFLCHEIRNPLHVIMANLDFLLESTAVAQQPQQQHQRAQIQQLLTNQGLMVAPEWVVAQLVEWQLQQQQQQQQLQGIEAELGVLQQQRQSSKDLARLSLSRDQSLQPTGTPSSDSSGALALSAHEFGVSPVSGNNSGASSVTTPLPQPQQLRQLSDPALAPSGYPLYPIADSTDATSASSVAAASGLTPYTMTPVSAAASGYGGVKRRTWPSMSASSSSSSVSSPFPLPAHLLPHFALLSLPGPGHLSLEQRQYLKAINHAAELMVSLCNDVLDVAKLESGVIVFDHLAVDLPLLCETFVSLSRPQALQKNISITLVWDPPPLPSRYVFCDPTRLHQVFLQIISNAIKFSKNNTTQTPKTTTRAAIKQQRTEQAADDGERKEEDARARLDRVGENLSSIFNDASPSSAAASSDHRSSHAQPQQPQQHAPAEIKFRVRAWYPCAAGSPSAAAAVDPSQLGANVPVPPAHFSPPLSSSSDAAARTQQQQPDVVLHMDPVRRGSHRGSVISVVNNGGSGETASTVELGAGVDSANHSPELARRPLLTHSQPTSDGSPARPHGRSIVVQDAASASTTSISSMGGGSPLLHSCAAGSTTPPLHPLSRHAAASVPLPSPQGGSNPFSSTPVPPGSHMQRSGVGNSHNGNGPRSMPPLVPRSSLSALAQSSPGASSRRLQPQSPGIGTHLQPGSNKPGSYGSARSSGSGSIHGLNGAAGSTGPPRLDDFQACSSSSSITVSASGSEAGDDAVEREIGERVHLIDIHGTGGSMPSSSASPPMRTAALAAGVGSGATPRFQSLISPASQLASDESERMSNDAAARARGEAVAAFSASAAGAVSCSSDSSSFDECPPQYLWVEFEVSDNGVGMDARQLAHIFTPYSETKLKTYRSRGGTGLGLAICREIVNQLEGEMFVTSTEGEGSTFVVRLRFQVAKQSDVLEAYFQDHPSEQEDPSQPLSATDAARRSMMMAEAKMQSQMQTTQQQQHMPPASSETASAATVTTVAPAATSLDLLSSPLFVNAPSDAFALPAADHTQFAASTAAAASAGSTLTSPSIISLPASGSAINSRENSSSAAAHFAAMFRPHMDAAELSGDPVPQTAPAVLQLGQPLLDATSQLHMPFVPAVQPCSAVPSASPQSVGPTIVSPQLSFMTPSVVPSDASAGPAASAPAVVASGRPRWRLLVVDDNEINRKLLSRMMRSLSYEVDMAEDGLVALEAVRNNMAAIGPPPPPLPMGGEAAPEDAAAQERRRDYEANRYCAIIMDLSMPVMDGYESTTAIRALGFTAPIIALTANALSEERAKALAAGCDDFCTKPIRKHELVQLMKHFCGHEQGHNAAAAAQAAQAGATTSASAPVAAALPAAISLSARQTSSPSPGRYPSHSNSASAASSPAVHSTNAASIGVGSLHLASTQPYAIGVREGTPHSMGTMTSSAASSSSPSPMGSSHRGSVDGQLPHMSLPGSPRTSGQGFSHSNNAPITMLPAAAMRIGGSRVSSANSSTVTPTGRPPLSSQSYPADRSGASSAAGYVPTDASSGNPAGGNPNRGSSGTPRHFKDRGSSDRDSANRHSGGSAASSSPQPPFASRSVSAAATPLGVATPRDPLTASGSKRGGSDGLPDSASSSASSGPSIHLTSPSHRGIPRASPSLASPSGGSMNLRRQLMQERGYTAEMAAEASAQGITRSPRRITLEPKESIRVAAQQHPQQPPPEFAPFDSDRSATPASSLGSSASPPALSSVPFPPFSASSGGVVVGASELSPPSQSTSLRPSVHQRTRSRGAINVNALVGPGGSGAGGVDPGLLLSAIRVQQEMQQKLSPASMMRSLATDGHLDTATDSDNAGAMASSDPVASSLFPPVPAASSASSASAAASARASSPVRPTSVSPSCVLRVASLEQVTEEARDPLASPRSDTADRSP